MAIALRKLIVTVLLVLILKGAAFGRMSISQIADLYAPSVVTILAFDKDEKALTSGSGFFISMEGDIATSHHVLEGSARAVIRTPEGRKGEITGIIKDDPDLDLLIATTSLRPAAPLPLGDSDRICEGEPVLNIGSSEGMPGVLSAGRVNRMRWVGGLKILQITAPILPGGSGGPVFALSGRVIGIATAFLDLGPDLNFAMPVNYLKALPPARSSLGGLPLRTTSLRAAIRARRLIEVLLVRDRKAATRRLNRPDDPSGCPACPGRYPNAGTASSPGRVYFKNGKTLLCDRAWKQGSTVFLVVRGKKYAVGYDQDRIDMTRSFRLSL
jgi:hypothetical protein